MSNKLYLFCAFVFIACNNDYTPKPWGYTRVDLPEQSTTLFESSCPYSFQQPDYSNINFKYKNECWFDLEFNDFNGKVHMSYKHLKGNLNKFTNY